MLICTYMSQVYRKKEEFVEIHIFEDSVKKIELYQNRSTVNYLYT